MALTTNCLYYLACDGDVTDSSGNSNDGTNDGTTNETSGLINQARQFDGANDNVRVLGIGSSVDYADETLNFWFKGSSSGIFEFVWNDDAFADTVVRHNDSNGMDFRIRQSAKVSTTTNFRDGNWHMCTILMDSTNFEVRIDDNLIGTGTIGSSTSESGEHYYGGASSGVFFFQGDLDEIGYWTRKLTSSEVTELYNSGSGKNPFASVDVTQNTLFVGGGI